jgi:hypothetical protein
MEIGDMKVLKSISTKSSVGERARFTASADYVIIVYLEGHDLPPSSSDRLLPN